MATNPAQIKTDIDNDLANKGYRGVRVIHVISALKKTVDWVWAVANANLSTWLRVDDGQPGGSNTDLVYHQGSLVVGRTNVDRSGAVVQAPSASFDTINGTYGDNFRTHRYQTAPNDGLPANRYYPFAELPVSAVATLDFANFEITGKTWDNNTGKPTHINLYVANRGAFYYEYSGTYLNNPGVAVEAYRQDDGRVVLFLRLDHAFRMATVQMPSCYQVAMYYPTPNGQAAPLGTQVLDTSSVGVYPPLHWQESGGLLHLPGGVEATALLTTGKKPKVSNPAAQVSAGIQPASTDLCGTLGLSTAGSTAAQTQLLRVTFGKPYAQLPRVLITANNYAGAVYLGSVFPNNISTEGFTLDTTQGLGSNIYCEFNYLIVG